MERTIAHTFLEIEQQFGFHCEDLVNNINILDTIIDQAMAKIKDEKEPIKVLNSISELIQENGFIYGEEVLLSSSLKTKKIDCNGRTILYYSIGETLNLPINIVMLPKHLFVRFDEINFETTKDTRQVKDEDYIRDFKLNDDLITKEVYFKNLTQKEIIALAYHNIGYVLTDNLQSIVANTQAIKLKPDFVSAFYNRGYSYYKEHDYDNAIADFKKSIDIDSTEFISYNLIARALIKKEEYKEAADWSEKGIEINPEYVSAYITLHDSLRLQKKDNEANIILNKALIKFPMDRRLYQMLFGAI